MGSESVCCGMSNVGSWESRNVEYGTVYCGMSNVGLLIMQSTREIEPGNRRGREARRIDSKWGVP